MPLTDEQKQYILKQEGFDPTNYTVDEDSQSIVEKQPVAAQPASNVTPYQPKITPSNGLQTGSPNSSAFGAFGKSALEAAPSSLAGGGGAAATMALLGGLGLDMTGVGAVVGLPLMAAGAYGASKLAKSAQQEVEPESWQQSVQQSQQEHPVASTLGQLATIPLSGFGPNSVGNLATAGRAIPKIATGMSLTGDEAAQLMNVGIGTALPPIQSVVESQAEGRPMPSLKELMLNSLVGAVMSKPNTIGKMMGFHDSTPQQDEFTAQMLDRIKKAKVSKVEDVSELSRPQQEQAQLQATGLLSGNLKNAQERSNKMADYTATPEPTTQAEESAENEGMPVRNYAKEATENLLKNGASKEDVAKISDDYQKALNEMTPEELQKVVSGEITHLQEESSLQTGEEQKTKDLLQKNKKTGNLTPEWWAMSNKLAAKRGAELQTNPDLPTTGQTTIPNERTTIGNIVAQVNPTKAGADTPTHELLHIFINDLRNSNRARDNQFVQKYDDLVKTLPDYQKWSQERIAKGQDGSVEEYQATNQGVESVNRALSNETPFQRWKNDFGSYLQTRWGKHATQADFQRIMNYKLLHDPAYYKILGLKGKPDLGIASGVTKNQDMSNLNLQDFSDEQKKKLEVNLFDLPIEKRREIMNLQQEASDIASNAREKSYAVKIEDKDRSPIDRHNEIQTLMRNKIGNTIEDEINKYKYIIDKYGNSKYQTGSNLVNPQHDSVKEGINMGVKKADSMSTEEADKLQEALRDQVSWPTESQIPDLLKSKDFDSMDSDHWEQLRKIYNNEYDSYAANKAATEKATTPKVSDKNTKTGSGQVEVPRTIPEGATESAKGAEEIAKVTEQRNANRVGKQPPNKKLTNVEELPSTFNEASLKREPYTPEEQKANALSSKMAWEEIDNTKDPQATMDSLKNQYNYALDKEHSYLATGDRDKAEQMANLRTAQLMRMHYLSDKKGVEVPKDLERFQTESNLPERNRITGEKNILPEDETAKVNELYKNGEITLEQAGKLLLGNDKNQTESSLKLPNLHNRVSEFGKKPDTEALDYSTPGIFTSQMDRIKKETGEEGRAFAKEFEKYAPMKDEMFGRYTAPIHQAAKGLSRGDLNKVENVMIQEFRDKESYRDLLSDKQAKLYDAVRESLRQKQQDQIDAGQLVTDYKPDGTKYQRQAQIDPYYYPNKISPKVAEELANNSVAAQHLKEDFLEHQKENGVSEKIAQSKLQDIENAYDVGKPNLTRFGAVRDAEGVGLPDSWMRNDLKGNLYSYFNRVAADRAFHDTFESNPEVLASAFPRHQTANPDLDVRDISGNKHVKDVTERILGEPFDKDESYLKAVNRVATSLMLGPLTNIHIAASSVANSLQYLRPLESVPALTKALLNITDGYQKALSSGRIKPNNSRFSDVVDINNTAIEKWRSAADMIGKINGRNLTNNFTHAYLQNVGEWIINSKSIAANAGDKSAQDLMKRVDPEWESGKSYTPEDVSKLASSFAGIIHGSHDARTLPSWMLKDTAIQPFLSLASWNIAQTNAWVRHVWTPAKEGNFVPLIMSTLGSALGGYVIKQGREAIADKKSPIPSLNEIVHSSRGWEGNIPLLAYNGLAMSSYVGYGGILSVAAKAAFDAAYKNIPQAATFPLDEVLGNSVHRITQAAGALMSDPTADYWHVGSRLAVDLAKENIQLARLAISWGANSKDVANNIPGMEQEAYSKQLNNQTADLRRYKMTEGQPYEEQSVSESNPYLGQSLKTFKRTQDMGDAIQQVPDLMAAAFKKANGNMDILRSELHKIKANTYPNMPDPERNPQTFVNYMRWLSETQSPDEAGKRLFDYMQHKYINKAKGEMVPTI